MPSENEQNLIPVRTIRIDLEDRSITFETADEPVARLVFSSGSIYFAPVGPRDALVTAPTDPTNSPGPGEESSAPEPREKERPVALSGRLKSQPRQGRPDSQGHLTAWARLAVHEEGRDDAHMYSATFHRGSARIALGLPNNAAVAVEGYPHPSNDPEGKRLDTLSVFRFLSSPGAPEPGAG